MKKLKTLLSILMAVTLIQRISPASAAIEIKADETYPMGCGNYEVAYVTDSGTFSTIGCYNDFNQAKNEMYARGNDAVVRHPASLSPTKIIAMSSGVAASYSYRRGSGSSSERTADVTMIIKQFETTTTNEKETYVTSHREMNYTGTFSYDPATGRGRIGVNLTGFAGYANLDQVDLIPTKFLSNNLRILLGGNNDGSPWEAPFWVRPRQSYYEVVQNGSYKEIVYHCWSYWAKSETPQDYSQTIGPAESWMNAGDVYYTSDMHALYTDRYFQNQVLVNGSPAQYYNYYEFLPLRSKSSLNGDVLNAFLNSRGYTEDATSYLNLKSNQSKMVNSGWYFVNAQETYGVNALLTFCMGLLESGWGRSQIAINKNNLFGWNAVDSNPGGSADSYSSIQSAIEQHMAYNLRGYMDINDVRFFGTHLGNKGSGFNVKYASDPYWGLKIAALAYQIDKYASGNNGTLTEYGKVELGVISQYNAAVKQSPDAASPTLYTTAYGTTYQNDFTVIIQNESNGWIQIPTANGIRADGSLVPHRNNGYEAYDWNRSLGYLPSSQITKLSAQKEEGNTPEGDFQQKVTALTMTDQGLSLSGYAYQPGIYAEEAGSLTHQLVITGPDGSEQTVSLDQNAYADDSHYAAAGFTASNIPLTLLLQQNGTYSLAIRTIHATYTETHPISGVTVPQPVSDLLHDYVFADDGTGLTLSRQDRVIEEQYNTLLKSLTLTEEGKLNIKGTAFVEGRHQGSADQIQHQLIVTDLNTGEQVRTFDLISYTGDEGDPNLNEGYNHLELGYDYSYGYYKGELDISDLPVSEYSFTIRTVADGKEFSRRLYGLSSMADSGVVKMNNGLYGELKKQYEFSNRYELAIRNADIELPSGKQPLPRLRESYQYLSRVVLNEEEATLTLKGAAYIWNGDFSAEQHPRFTLVLIHRESGETFSASCDGLTALTGGDYSWDITEEKGGQSDYSHAWYEITVPLQQLKDGEYEFRLMIETDSYVDLLDYKSKSSLTLPSLEGDKTLTVSRNTANKNRIEMTLSGWLDSSAQSETPASSAPSQPVSTAVPTPVEE